MLLWNKYTETYFNRILFQIRTFSFKVMHLKMSSTQRQPCSVYNMSRGRFRYGDVIMGAMASKITSLAIVYLTVYSGADQRKHQSSTSLAFVRRIHRWPVNSPEQRASDAENISIWWRHHDTGVMRPCVFGILYRSGNVIILIKYLYMYPMCLKIGMTRSCLKKKWHCLTNITDALLGWFHITGENIYMYVYIYIYMTNTGWFHITGENIYVYIYDEHL